MARIRSVHPGQWTAGDFLECSPMARLLALALRNHADDHGVFRWKPKTIKAECLPADNCDIECLLAELITNDQVQKYAAPDGKEYGIIIDFTQWQRPKKPKYIHPVPNWFSTGTEPDLVDGGDLPDAVPNPSVTGSEIPPQRKEEGGRREEDGGGVERGRAGGTEIEPASSAAPRPKSLISSEAFEITTEILKAMGKHPDDPLGVASPYTVQNWLSQGISRDAIMFGVTTAMSRKRHDPPSTFNYFEKAVLRASVELNRPLPKVEVRQPENLTVTSKQHGNPNGPRSVHDAARDLSDKLLRELDEPAPRLREPSGGGVVRLLPSR